MINLFLILLYFLIFKYLIKFFIDIMDNLFYLLFITFIQMNKDLVNIIYDR